MDESQFQEKLVSELQGIRESLRDLEKFLIQKRKTEDEGLKTRAPRQPLKSEVELVGDFDILEAEGVDISDSGICFDLKNSLYFDMRFLYGEVLVEKRARLVWVRQMEDGYARLGFNFEDSDSFVEATPQKREE